MTTKITVEANCSEDQEVVVSVYSEEDEILDESILPNGEYTEKYVYAERYVKIEERYKQDE